MRYRNVIFALIFICMTIIVFACGTPMKQASDEVVTATVESETETVAEIEIETKAEEETVYRYRELEDMDEITIEDDKIIFVVYENQAIPYRWKTVVDNPFPTLITDEVVYGKGDMFSAGDSPAYHVFIYQWEHDGEAFIELIHARYNDDDPNEAAEIRSYFVSKYGEEISCVELE